MRLELQTGERAGCPSRPALHQGGPTYRSVPAPRSPGNASAPSRSRRGLAPLELVLSLVFLLMMMALIINFGTVASWHARGTAAARYAVWRSLAIRTGATNPNPSNWWPPATLGMAPGMPLNPNTVGQVWSQGDLMQPALRGPAVVDPASGQQILLNDKRYLEMVDQALIGAANLSKTMPLLPRLRQAQVNPMQPVLDPFWRFQDMGIGDNNNWRIKGWYRIEADQIGNGDLMKLFMQYQMADQQILGNPGSQALLPLDRDDEEIAWWGSPRDRYPTVGGCEASPQNVQMNLVSGPRGLISRIQGINGGGLGGVPERVARDFIEMYREQIRAQQPPNQANIQQLQARIEQLIQFIGTLN